MFSFKDLDDLDNAWSAEIRMKNDQVISIWYTAWEMSKDTTKEIISISSDYPRVQLFPVKRNNRFFIG